jgi:hypothetical protein
MVVSEAKAMNKKEVVIEAEREVRESFRAQNPFYYSAAPFSRNVEDLWKEDYADKKDL